MASGTCRGRKNKEENYLCANSKGEHRHCGVMNKSFYSVYIRHQLTFQRNCSTGITAPPCSVPCSSHGCVHPSPFPLFPSRIRCHMLVPGKSPVLKPLPGHWGQIFLTCVRKLDNPDFRYFICKNLPLYWDPPQNSSWPRGIYLGLCNKKVFQGI